ncbi:MAG TPA: EF-P beta-lysylation protein EpmB [Steroidobacteraceae bacterium]|nr:EF-P beta-lysylation protein EpmB [Steroidobacteraceae bacterium]
MIATTTLASQKNVAALSRATETDWRRLAADAITDPAELLEILRLDRSLLPGAQKAAQTFGLRVPRGFVARMRPGDPRDPLLLQVLPLIDELIDSPEFSHDPVGDLASRSATGVLHKYEGRALLIATGACAIHCRYCFRRHFPYADETASKDEWKTALDHVRSDATINEIILSGGDPLNLSDRRLEQLTTALADVPHVRRLRIHTRTAVTLPERIDAHFCKWLTSVRLQKIVVLHTNHAQEFDASAQAMCARIKDCNAALFNQSVLLAGVNDNVDALSQLSETLFASGVLPYYLSLLDRVTGAAHFEVSEPRAVDLMRRLIARLPGYLIPKLVREVAGAEAKTSVSLLA